MVVAVDKAVDEAVEAAAEEVAGAVEVAEAAETRVLELPVTGPSKV